MSQMATRHDIINAPNIEETFALRTLSNECLDRVRVLANSPIHVISGYRSRMLNILVKGEAQSQHMYGEAADIVSYKIDIDELFNMILQSDIEFDQIINEYGRWIHISYVKDGNRNEILKAIMMGSGKPDYLQCDRAGVPMLS